MPYVVIKIGRGDSTILGKEGKTKIGLVNKKILSKRLGRRCSKSQERNYDRKKVCPSFLPFFQISYPIQRRRLGIQVEEERKLRKGNEL